MSNYIPHPVDTSDIVLDSRLNDLVEAMAENVHEIWARTRIEQGWKYGQVRNDDLKEHPCIVPYSELPESEKDFDRNTAMGTLKLIMALGYTIEKK